MSNNSKNGNRNESTSTSSRSTSLYETPMTSPPNESSFASTAIDSLQFDLTSNITETIDLLDSRQSFESLSNRSVESTSASVETNSTLKAQQFNENQNLMQKSSTNNEIINQSLSQSMKYSQNMMSSIPESSFWFRRLTNPLTNDCIDLNVNNSEKYVLLLKYMSELDCEHLQMIGLQQQIDSISIQCKTIRQNIASKTNSIHQLINDIILSKQSAQTQTQHKPTQTQTTHEVINLSKNNLFDSHESLPLYTSRKTLINDSFSNLNTIINNNFSELKENKKPIFAEISNSTKKKLSRLPALVKGYLIRRLMKTEKVLNVIKTIRDTTKLLINFKKSPPNRDVTPEDVRFHKRLIIQLENACHEFYDILINYPKSAQMALITRSREHLVERQFRTGSVLSTSTNLTSNFNSSLNSSVTNGLSSVTKKRLERKIKPNPNIIPDVKESQSLGRTYSTKTSINPFSKNISTSSGSLIAKTTATAIMSSNDSNNRTNLSLRRSQRNNSKIKINPKRKSPNKRK